MDKQKQKPLVSKYPSSQLLSNLKPFLSQTSPFAENPLEEDWFNQCIDSLQIFQILVVGAGGLGCELVKNLALSGIKKIHLIDMDTIQLSNLNRQFLFRNSDIGKYKSQAVANFVMRRCPGIQVVPYTCRVQEKDYKFYSQFQVIIGGLDNIQARRFLNLMVHQINEDQNDVVCIYIDGATQGFEGQCIVVQPFKTSCYDCSLLEGLAEQPKANSCTIANTPRTPQHCIQYILQTKWSEKYPDTERDNDNQQHIRWIYQQALERAKQFKIEGVTQMLTLGVAKNIIPAIASTNAFIAAFCTNQALKAILATNPNLKNYIFYRGGTSVGSDSYQFGKKKGCIACQMKQNKLKQIDIQIESKATILQLIKAMRQKNTLISVNPYVNIKEKLLFNPFDYQRREQKQKKTLQQLRKDGYFTQNPQRLIVTDNNLKSEQVVNVTIVQSSQ